MVEELLHVMNINSGSITASSSATDTIEIGSNEEFTAYELRIVSATGSFSLEITDQTGRAYQQEAVHFVVKDNAKDIFRLPMPLQMSASTKFSFKFTDTSTSANQVRAQLWGIKKYL